MVREDRVDIPLPSQVMQVVTFIKVLGHSHRPLRDWLKRHYAYLYTRNFENRSTVLERRSFADLGTEQHLTELVAQVQQGKPLRLWLAGPGGSGKSTLAFEVVRRCFPSENNLVLPLVIDEDWPDNVASLLQKMLTVDQYVLSEKMIRKLALSGHLLLLFDAFSERMVEHAEEQLKDCFDNDLFKYGLVTSRTSKPESAAFSNIEEWQPGHLRIE